jgi:hypothetical protein
MMRSLLRHLPIGRLPISDYHKTLLWSAAVTRPRGRREDWAYFRCIELATLAFATPQGYGTAFPGAGDPTSRYSMLEFGVAAGASLQIMLHFRDVLLRRLRLPNQVTVLGFDTFEGLPPPREGDDAAPWQIGDYHEQIEQVQRHLERSGFRDFELVKGLFADTLKDKAAALRDAPPIFVAIDCDYYSSTIDIFDALIPTAPHGCLFYFDDVAAEFYSTKTGELKAIREVNEGRYGDHIELVHYPLWIETREMRHWLQVYRLVNVEKAKEQIPPRGLDRATPPGRISPA